MRPLALARRSEGLRPPPGPSTRGARYPDWDPGLLAHGRRARVATDRRTVWPSGFRGEPG